MTTWRVVADTQIFEIHAGAAHVLQPLGFFSLGWGGVGAQFTSRKEARTAADAARKAGFEVAWVTWAPWARRMWWCATCRHQRVVERAFKKYAGTYGPTQQATVTPATQPEAVEEIPPRMDPCAW